MKITTHQFGEIEFEKGHINGAVNIPLFTDYERKEVGIIYKNFGRINAIEKGLGFVGPKMKIISLLFIMGSSLFLYCALRYLSLPFFFRSLFTFIFMCEQ